MSEWSELSKDCEEALFYEKFKILEDEQKTFLLITRGEPQFDLEKLPRLCVPSYKELWKLYWKKVGGDKPETPKNYQTAFRQLALDPKTKAIPILLSPDLFFAAQFWGSSKRRVSFKEKEDGLPEVQLVSMPERKAWPYALLGDTKKIKDLLKFSDSSDKISAYVTNVNKEFGPGWNLKQEAVDLLEEQNHKLFRMTSMSLEEYRG